MKKIILPALIIFSFAARTYAQPKYVSVDWGAFFGNANANIENGMRQSGYADMSVADFFGLFTWTTNYPRKRIEKSAYRIRLGYPLKSRASVEAGYGMSYMGVVEGHHAGSGSYLDISSSINTLYAAYVFHDSAGRVGLGIGPVLSFYRMSADFNNKPSRTDNHITGGGILTGYWNFLSKRSWFAGVRSDIMVSAPVKIKEMNFPATPSTSPPRYKSINAGSFTGSVTFQAGIRF